MKLPTTYAHLERNFAEYLFVILMDSIFKTENEPCARVHMSTHIGFYSSNIGYGCGSKLGLGKKIHIAQSVGTFNYLALGARSKWQ